MSNVLFNKDTTERHEGSTGIPSERPKTRKTWPPFDHAGWTIGFFIVVILFAVTFALMLMYMGQTRSQQKLLAQKTTQIVNLHVVIKKLQGEKHQLRTELAHLSPRHPIGTKAFRPGVYTLQYGDTLSGLALRAYGRASAWKHIAAWNPYLPQDLRTMRAGWKIIIPPLHAMPPAHERAQGNLHRSSKRSYYGHEGQPTTTISENTTAAHTAAVTTRYHFVVAPPTASIALATVQPTATLDDPALIPFTGSLPTEPMERTPLTRLALQKVSYATTIHTKPLIPAHVRNHERGVRHSNTKAFALLLPTGIKAPLNRKLKTRIFFFTPGEEIATSQKLVGFSIVKMRKGKPILYIPLRTLPSQRFNLGIMGLNRPISSTELRADAIPVKRMPGKRGRVARFLLGNGVGIAGGAISYAAAPTMPEITIGMFVAPRIYRWIVHHRRKMRERKLEAKQNPVVNAQLHLARAEYDAHTLIAQKSAEVAQAAEVVKTLSQKGREK